jgi:hypothetical protein
MRVRLRKPHACGADVFTVVALGADIRLTCTGCGTKVFVDRARFRNRVRAVLAGGPGAGDGDPPIGDPSSR